MYPNQEVDRKQVVVDTPGGRRETTTETRQEGPREFSFSPGVLVTLAILALIAIGLTIYVVSNKNANEEANRQAMLEANRANQQQPPASSPAPPQQPVIIQPQAPVQQPPVVIQQPPASVMQEKVSPLDDTTIQDAATKRLAIDPTLVTTSVIVIGGRATLVGTVDSPELKAKAERVVKAVRGVKSVENKIEVSNK
jgi:hypothetical protein